jgi:ATP-dependent helicase/nuclease subunit B
MAVQFILGRSGTGKTSFCIKAIVDALIEPAGNQQLILLVPEQASYQAERAILADKRISGYSSGSPHFKEMVGQKSRLNVLSFDRLQFLVLGKNTARPALSHIGQQMIIHRLLRDNVSKLRIFGPSATQIGLSRQMAETIGELHRYAKTPDDIERLLEKLEKDKRNSLAALKFSDIGLILKEYLASVEGKFADPDIQLRQVCRAVAGAEFVKGARLWVDGFAGFTGSELAILTELLKVVSDAQIALCLEPRGMDLANPEAGGREPFGLFGPTEQTYAGLFEIIKKCKLQTAEPIILDRAVRFSGCPELAHIERHIFELEAPKIAAGDSVRIVSAPNARAEVQFVARQILQLVKEKDYRYRDIAVIASDIESYQHYIRACLDDYQIPFFIDKRKPLSQHPAAQLICSALEVVSGGFSHSDIFTFLKTDLVPVERCEVDLLENYCIAFGIRGEEWQSDKEWHFSGEDDEEFDEERINEIRWKVSGPLLELRDSVCPSDKPGRKISSGEFIEIIFNFIDGLGVRERLGEWIEEAVEAGDYAAVDEHRQFYDKLLSIFDELVEVFGESANVCEDYLAILKSAFSQLTLAFIPPTLDQVLVGSIERSRHPDLKAVFLIGASQRQFPAAFGSEGILSDDDRTAADAADFPLAATVGQRLAERQYLAYIAFTRPSEFLCVTYPLADDKGSSVARSQFIANLESLFEGLSEEPIGGEQMFIEGLLQGRLPAIHSRAELADLLCSQLGKDAIRLSRAGAARDSPAACCERLGELLSDIRRDKELAELGSRVVCAISYDNKARLSKGIVEKLFGRQINCSVTQLSTFAACPYQYFARYILAIKERREFKLEPLDVGNFYHRVLDALLKQLNLEKKDFATIQDEELVKLLRGKIGELIETDCFVSHFASRSFHNEYIIHSAGEMLEDCVLAIAQMVRAGSFRPSRSEVSFGKIEGAVESISGYEAGLSDKRVLSVHGKIDRLDIADVNGGKAAIVFDYKRSGKSFSWAQLYYGLDMQLPIYMLAVGKAGDSENKIQEAAGAFYMPIEVRAAKSTLNELSKKTGRFNYKAKGIFNGEFAGQIDGLTSSGWSNFYSFRITPKEGQYGNYGTSSALRPGDFEKVLRFTEKKTIQLAEEILRGRIDVRPYRLSRKSPCSYCKYKPLCRFDWQINDYRPLESLGKIEVLKEMERFDG